KSPDRRFQSASDLAFAIESLSGSGTSPSIPVPVLSATKNPWKWMAWAACGVTCLAIGAAVAWAMRPKPRPVPTFKRISYDEGTLVRGRYASDEKTIYYAGIKENGVPETYIVREDYPASTSAGLEGALLLAISRNDHMAVLMRPQYYGQNQFGGML